MDMNYHAATGPLVPSAPLPLTSDMDKMFTDLGLETFVTREADSQRQEMKTSQSASSLSLDDKQRLVRQQEQSQRLQASGDLIAKPMGAATTTIKGPSVRLPSQPTDLTTRMIDSNLQQIRSPPGNNNSGDSGNSNWMTSENSGWGAMMGANSTSTTSGNWNANFNQFNAGMTSPQQPQPVSAFSRGPAASGVGSSNANYGNWSALDNLLPAKPQKTPINQMGGQQPLMSHSHLVTSPTNSNRSANQLSQQDIMEFLG